MTMRCLLYDTFREQSWTSGLFVRIWIRGTLRTVSTDVERVEGRFGELEQLQQVISLLECSLLDARWGWDDAGW